MTTIFSIQIVLDETHREGSSGITGSTALEWHTFNFIEEKNARVLLHRLRSAAEELGYIEDETHEPKQPTTN